jgi:hypothetical protein
VLVSSPLHLEGFNGALHDATSTSTGRLSWTNWPARMVDSAAVDLPPRDVVGAWCSGAPTAPASRVRTTLRLHPHVFEAAVTRSAVAPGDGPINDDVAQPNGVEVIHHQVGVPQADPAVLVEGDHKVADVPTGLRSPDQTTYSGRRQDRIDRGRARRPKGLPQVWWTIGFADMALAVPPR